MRTNTNFIDTYIDRALLTGRAFSSDASKLHSYLVRLIYEKTFAEHNILPYKDSSYGHVDFIELKEYYLDVGAKEKDIITAQRDI